MFSAPGVRYEKVAIADSDSENGAETPRSRASVRSRLARHFNIAFFAVNIIFLATTLWQNGNRSANWILKQSNYYTPILDQFPFKFHDTKHNASLFNTPYSIYKADPSPESDEAWEAISDTPVYVVTKEEVVKMGKDPEYTVSIPEEFGYGKEKYFAVLDSQHLLHCLSELRKYSYPSHFYPNTTAFSPLQSAHRSHCIGVLLDALTCQPSLNFVTWTWMEGHSEPWPDFEAYRKCYGGVELFDWVGERQVDRRKIKGWEWRRPEGEREIPELEELKGLREEGKVGEGEGKGGIGHQHEGHEGGHMGHG